MIHDRFLFISSKMLCSKEELSDGPWIADIEKYPQTEYIFYFEGYKCTVKRMEGWNWNGYIELPLDHPSVGSHYSDIDDIDVHGGLTYSKENIFGFDTSHFSDLVPGHIILYKYHPFSYQRLSNLVTYKTLEFVKEELKKLALQFKKKK